MMLALLAVLCAGRVLQAMLAGWALGRAYERWLYADGKDGQPTARRILTGVVMTAFFMICAIISHTNGPAD